MKKIWVTFWLFFGVLTMLCAQDQEIEQVTIVTQRYDYDKFNRGHAVYHIDSTQIHQVPGQSLATLLDKIPNFKVIQSHGNFGSIQEYRFRGGRSKDILILINGIPISDDSQISNFQDLNLIDTNDIAHIDVITSGGATIYGANASAGIINIQLKPNKNNPFLAASMTYESYQSFSGNLRAAMPLIQNKLTAQISGQFFSTKGFSAAIDSTKQNDFDRDAGKRIGFNAQISYEPKDYLKAKFISRLTNERFDYDDGAYRDGNNVQKGDQWLNQFSGQWENAWGRTTANISLINNERDQMRPVQSTIREQYSSFTANQYQGDVNHITQLNKWGQIFEVMLGGYYKYAESDQSAIDFTSGQFQPNLSADSSRQTRGEAYATIMTTINRVGFQAGTRYSSPKGYDGKWIYHLKSDVILYNEAQHKIQCSASLSSAYNTPSLYQLYSIYGNQNLHPESSNTVDAALRYNYNETVLFTGTVFQRKEFDAIDFSNQKFAYQNINGKNTIKGAEFQLQLNPLPTLALSFDYGLTSQSQKVNEYKLPKNLLGAHARYQFHKNSQLNISYKYVGDRQLPYYNPTTFSSEIYNANAYHLLDCKAQFLINKKVKTYGYVRNILDQEYMDNYGYQNQGLNLGIGIEFEL